MLASIVTIFLLYHLFGAAGTQNYYNALSLDLCIGILSTITAVLYISKPYIFISLIILLVIGALIYINLGTGNSIYSGMFAIGTTYGLLYREFVLNPRKQERTNADRRRRRTEINRDYVHIILGIVMFAVALLLPYQVAIVVIFGLILLGYAANNLLANLRLNPIYRRAMDLERKNATYGLGATHLAASMALLLGFITHSNFLLFGIVAVFFADPMATIVGLSTRNATSLPYNRNKTLIGSFAYFVVAALAGYYFLGWYGILFAAILAFVESINLSLDDNIRSGIVIVLLSALSI